MADVRSRADKLRAKLPQLVDAVTLGVTSKGSLEVAVIIAQIKQRWGFNLLEETVLLFQEWWPLTFQVVPR